MASRRRLGGRSDGNTPDHLPASRQPVVLDKDVDRLLDEQREDDDPRSARPSRAAEKIYVQDDPARVWYRFRAVQLLTVKKLQGLEAYPDSLIRFQYGWLQK